MHTLDPAVAQRVDDALAMATVSTNTVALLEQVSSGNSAFVDSRQDLATQQLCLLAMVRDVMSRSPDLASIGVDAVLQRVAAIQERVSPTQHAEFSAFLGNVQESVTATFDGADISLDGLPLLREVLEEIEIQHATAAAADDDASPAQREHDDMMFLQRVRAMLAHQFRRNEVSDAATENLQTAAAAEEAAIQSLHNLSDETL